MKAEFSSDRKYVVFIPETVFDNEVLAKFPGTMPSPEFHYCKAILPIAFNVVSRMRRAAKVLKVSPSLATWLSGSFRLKQIPESFEFHTEPLELQVIALRFLYTLGSAGLLLEPGMGKSKVVLDYIMLMGFKKVIITCPKPLCFVWEDEIRTHRPELTSYTVQSTSWEDEKKGIEEARVVIINYTKATLMKDHLKKIEFDFMHIDEFLIKDVHSDRTKSLTSLSLGIPYRCGGSGTLINNSPLDAYAPLRYLHRDLVGAKYYNFLYQYTVQKNIVINQEGDVRKQVVAFKNEKEVRAMIDSCCIVMTKAEWLKLPDKVFRDFQVQMADDQRDTYYNLLKNRRAEVNGVEVQVDNALVMLSKLYQIANGFLYLNSESKATALQELLQEDIKPSKKERDVHYFSHQPKIEKLRSLMADELLNRKFILWYNMDGERVLLENLLQELQVNYSVIKGGEKDVAGKVKSFNNDLDIKVLVCQAKSVNYGVTVLGKKIADLESYDGEILPSLDTRIWTQVFYSMSFSLEVFLQQQDRTHRVGQTRTCEYYRLFSNCSIEHQIKIALEEKLRIKKSMLIDIAESLGRMVSGRITPVDPLPEESVQVEEYSQEPTPFLRGIDD